ncbi:hypothetical protein C3K23_00445 (plasmid) [Streptomyces sp. 604F]|nr:hypothetical protein B9S66_31015 [Streptomyces sp. SM17]QHV83499.1 hypothetical protein C3K23_00445 [Streptomyces sp. 604F]
MPPCRCSHPERPADPTRAAHDPIDLTVPEIRHLLAAVLTPLCHGWDHLTHWSTWRRRHQFRARRSHYRHRLASGA